MFEVRQTAVYSDWFDRLRDRQAQARINIRIRRLSLGNFGDAKPVGGGVAELRIDYGPGYRVYFVRRRKALVIYLTAGDPDHETSGRLMNAALDAGADIVEVGVPWSDPSADGVAIARASQRSLARGGGLEETLRVARAVRAKSAVVPIVLFGYYNPLFVNYPFPVPGGLPLFAITSIGNYDFHLQTKSPAWALTTSRDGEVSTMSTPEYRGSEASGNGRPSQRTTQQGRGQRKRRR